MKRINTILILALAFALLSASAWANVITSTGTGGNWSNTATWVGGILPVPADDAIIADGATVLIDQTVTITNLTVGQGTSGTLMFDGAVAGRAVVVTGNITIATGGTFITQPLLNPTGDLTIASTTIANVSSTAGVVVGMAITGTGIPASTTVTAFDATTITISAAATATGTGVTLTIGAATNTLALTGNITNNGTLDFSRLVGFNASALCNTTFNNAAGDQIITGTTPVMTRFRGITLNKGAVANRVVCSIDVSKSGSGVLAFTAGTWEQTAGTFTFSNGNEGISTAAGSLVISGSGSLSDGGASLTIALGNITCNTTGTFLQGSGNNSTTINSGTLNLLAGTVTFNGKLVMVGGTTTITGANITINQQATVNATTGNNAFDLQAAANFNMSGGSVTFGSPNAATTDALRTGRDLKIATPSTGVYSITGGYFSMGDGNTTPVSGGATGYTISCNAPTALVNLIVQGGGVVGRNVLMTSNLTLNGTLSMRSGTINLGGKTITYGAAGTLKYDGTTAIATTPSEWPTAGGPANVIMSNAAGVTLDASKTITGALTLTSGNITTGANTLTASGTISGASASSYIDGKLARVYGAPASLAFPVGKSGNYRPLSLNYTALTGTSTVTAEQFESGFAGAPPPGVTQVGTRYWNVTQSGGSAFTYDITLDGTGMAFTYNPRILKYDSPTTLALTPTTPNYTATGLTTLSDFAFGEQPTLITSFPYAEGFESVTFPPTDWSSAILTGTYNWGRVTAGVHPVQAPYSGAGEASFDSYNASTGSNARLITPAMAVPAGYEMNFRMFHDAGFSSSLDSIAVEVTTDAGTSWTSLAQYLRYNASTGWQGHAVPLPSGTIQVAFHAWSRFGNAMFIDSAVVRQTPLVPDPAGIVSPLNAATNVLLTATLNWSAPGGGPLTGYKLFFGTDGGGTVPPTNIVPGTDQGNVLTYDPTPDMSYGTTYYWQVVPWGPGGDATGCPIWSFTTGADPTVSTFPYTQNFDAVTPPALAYGWSRENTNGDTHVWVTAAVNPRSAPNAMAIGYNSALAMDDWFFTPPMVLTGGTTYRVKFWYRAQGFPESMEVKWGATASSAGMTNGPIFNNASITSSTYAEGIGEFVPSVLASISKQVKQSLDMQAKQSLDRSKPVMMNEAALKAKKANRKQLIPESDGKWVTAVLRPATTGTYYVGFHGYSAADEFNLYVDDFSIEEVPLAPPNPAVLVSPANAGTDVAISATLNWDTPVGGGAVSGYKLYFGTDNPPTNIVNGTDQGMVLTYNPTPDMAYSTPYYWQIVPTGPSGDATGCPIWSFTTLANPTVTVFPYAEGFENVTFPPTGWSSEILNGTFDWDRVTAGINPVQLPYSGLGEAHYDSYDALEGQNARLSTPPMVVPTAGLQVHFYMYHDPFFGIPDSLTLDVTTDAGTNWTILATFMREAAVAGWQSHLVPLTGYTGTIQVGFHAWSAYGDDMFVDSVRVEEVPPPPSNYPPAIAYTPLSSTTVASAPTLIATITDDFGVDSTVAGGPRLWYRSGATVPLSGPYTAITGTRTAPGASTWNFSLPALSSVTFVEYYVAAQDSNLAVTTEPAGTDSTTNPPNATVAAPNRFVVSTPLTFTVGTAGANFPSISEGLTWFYGGIDGPLEFLLNSDYTSAGEVFPIFIGGIPGLGTFSDAMARSRSVFAARPTGSSREVGVRGLASGELSEAVFGTELAGVKSKMRDRAMKVGRIRGLGAMSSGRDNVLVTNTFTIKPNVAATPGPIAGDDGGFGGLITLSAANYVTIEGLTIQNTGTGGIANTAFLFTDGSSFNRIVNCTLQAGHIHPNIGVIWTTDDVIASGCNNNVIDNCNITAYLGVRPTAGVTFYTAPPLVDTDDTLKNSRVYDYGNANATYGGGAYGFWAVESTDRMVVLNNEFYMASPAASTGAAASYAGILIGSSATGMITNAVIRNNNIHDINATGTPALVAGISAGSGANINGVLVDGNTIHDLAATTTVGGSGTRGAYVAGGLNQTFTRNTFKDLQTLTPGGVVIGLRLSGAAGGQAFKTVWTNNMIVLGNVGTNDNVVYRGINDNGGTDDTMIVAFNSVYIGGVSASTAITDAYVRTLASQTTLRDNVFHNQRFSSGIDYAIRSTPATGGTFSSNYNILFADGAAGVLGAWAGVNQVALADWQTASGGDANSINADPMYVDPLVAENLHITDPASPASNAGTPVAGVTVDFDGDARNATTPDVGADEFASSTTVGVPIALLWNIVSLPVSSPTPDDSVQHLFTNSFNKYGFAFEGGYVQRYVMANGPGYWIKSSATYTQNITGVPRDTLTVPVASAWNMIGSISTSIDTSVSRVTPSVSGLRSSAFFKYANGYVIATTIDPGFGYWVKASSAGSFFMHATGPAGKVSGKSVTSTEGSIEELNTITIRDANGGSQTLYFGADANGEIPVAMFAMPPAPPMGAFDARFESSEGGTMVQTHMTKVSDAMEFPVTVQSSAYPLTITWNVNKGTASYELTDGVGGRVFHAKEMRGEGTIKIANSSVSRFSVKLASDGQLPTEYALSQNYPNPFNPTTNIKYALPVDSKLTMEIYNVLGQRVRTLVNDNVAAGFHIAEWDGTGNAGQQLASGMYFLQMSAKGTNGKTFSDVRKLVMLK